MKLQDLHEELRPILLDLIQQRLSKKENVYLEFWAPAKAAGSRMDFVDGKVTSVDGNSAYFHTSTSNAVKRYTFGPEADEKYRLDKVKNGWKVRSVKTRVAEATEGLLPNLVANLLKKHEPVWLNFWWYSDTKAMELYGQVIKVEDNTFTIRKAAMSGANYTETFVMPPNADDKLDLHKGSSFWEVRKREPVKESLDGMLKTLIQRQLDKHVPVKLDFVENGTRYQGYVQLIRGNTLHTLYVKRGGDKETERYVLPLNADERFTLRKVDGMLHLQGI